MRDNGWGEPHQGKVGSSPWGAFDPYKGLGEISSDEVSDEPDSPATQHQAWPEKTNIKLQ